MKYSTPMIDSSKLIDSTKRKTLKRLAGTAGASAALVSIPSFANFVETPSTNANALNSVDIEATLVSIPGTTNETLLLKNVSQKPISINQFVDARVSFDNETIDCGAVCDSKRITIPVNEDVMVHFSSSAKHANTISKPLNVQAAVNRLPEGTRVIPLKASVSGSIATLLHA